MQHNFISDLPARRRRAYFIPRTLKKINGWVADYNNERLGVTQEQRLAMECGSIPNHPKRRKAT